MGRKKERMSIIFRSDQMLCAREELSDAELGRLYEALRAYSIDGVLPALEEEREAWRVLFSMMRAAQDDAIRKYDETCERNRQKAMLRVQPAAATAATAATAAAAANIIEDSRIEDKRIEDKRIEDKRIEDKRIEDKRIEDKRIQDKRIQESRIAASALVGPEGGTGIDGVRWL